MSYHPFPWSSCRWGQLEFTAHHTVQAAYREHGKPELKPQDCTLPNRLPERKNLQAFCVCFPFWSPFGLQTHVIIQTFWMLTKRGSTQSPSILLLTPDIEQAHHKEDNQTLWKSTSRMSKRWRKSFNSEWFLRGKISNSNISAVSGHIQEEWKADQPSTQCDSCVQPHWRPRNRETGQYWAHCNVNL